MKAALGGGLNLSIRDGWWDEWFDGQNGWAIPTADGVADPDRRDEVEARAIYELLDTQVLPRFYEKSRNGVPAAGWRWCRPPGDRPQGARDPDGAGLRAGICTCRPPAAARWPTRATCRPARSRLAGAPAG